MAYGFEVQRQGWRIECGERCVLHHNGVRTGCILVDISVSGVLLDCPDDVASHMQPGDSCGLFLCSNAERCAVEVPCIVTRRDAARIGLRFPPELMKQESS